MSAVGDFLGSAATGSVSWIGKAVEAVASPFAEWQKRKTEVSQAEHELEMADIAFRSQLIMNRESHNQAWELEALKAPPKRGPMQWISFLVLGMPFIIAWFDPILVQQYFLVSLAVIPIWYQKTFLSIIGVIWGIAKLKDAADGINKMMLQRKMVDVSSMVAQSSEKIIRPKLIENLIKDKAKPESIPDLDISALKNHR
jgi:hypothetical protein